MSATVKKPGTGKAGPTASGLTSTKSIELPEGMWDRIRTKAHELWEARGRQEGDDLRNWLDAEDIVMEEIHEARE